MNDLDLSAQRLNYIESLCHETMTYIADHFPRISPNMIDGLLNEPDREIRVGYYQRPNGLMGYSVPHLTVFIPDSNGFQSNKPKNSHKIAALSAMASSMEASESNLMKKNNSDFLAEGNTEGLSAEEMHQKTHDSLYDSVRRFGYRFQFFTQISETAIEDSGAVEALRAKQNNAFPFFSNQTRELMNSVKNNLEAKTGRCAELCEVAYWHLKKAVDTNMAIHINVFQGKNFDHTFIALSLPGMIKGGDDFRHWSRHTIIFDPWLRCSFPLEKMPLYWQDMAKAMKWVNPESLKGSGYSMADKFDVDIRHPLFRLLKPAIHPDFIGLSESILKRTALPIMT